MYNLVVIDDWLNVNFEDTPLGYLQDLLDVVNLNKSITH